MKNGDLALTRELPGRHVAELRVVALRLSIGRLMFRTEMASAPFFAMERILDRKSVV